LVREIFAGVSGHLDALFAMQGIGSFAIASAGSQEQRRKWLPLVATGAALAALALTEPDAGSDLRRIVTSLSVEKSSLVVDGRKSFITNGGVAAFYTTLVREPVGLSLVLIPASATGVRTESCPALISPHVISDVIFEAVSLQPDARIGLAGSGFEHIIATLAVFRASVGAAAIGLAHASLEAATRHVKSRHQFGKPLARHGAVEAMLADSYTEIEMAKLLVYRAAWLAAKDPSAAITQSSMAKLAATEVAGRVVDRCVQMMGRFGLIHDSTVERLYRQARPMRIYEGASEVLRPGIARYWSDQVN
jgi:acyl-CoA dehydrogenase